MSGDRGLITCSWNGETSEATSNGAALNVPAHVEPPGVPVHTPVPVSGSVVDPVGFPPVSIVPLAAIADAGRAVAYSGTRSLRLRPG